MVDGIGIKTILSLIVMYTVSFCVGQEAVQRYYAAKTDKTAMVGSLMASGIYVLFAFIPTVLGLACFVLVKNGVIDGTVIANLGPKYALPCLAVQIMPPVLTGLLFAGLISATMSSADSDLLGAGSIFANDIYRIYINPDADDKRVVRVTQASMAVLGLFAGIIALTNTKSIIGLLMFSFTLRAGGAFVPYVLGHYWRKASWEGCMAALISGSLTVIAFQSTSLDFWGLEPIFPSLIISFVTFVVFSLYKPGTRLINEKV
jgi:SSS family solute:Na+ symporter